MTFIEIPEKAERILETLQGLSLIHICRYSRAQCDFVGDHSDRGAVCVHDDGDEGQSERCKYIWLYAADGTVGFHGTDVCCGRSDFYQKM